MNILSYLSLTEDRLSILEPASVSGGILRTWPGKYQVLVHKRPNACIKGSVHDVSSKEQKDALRCYETDKYEVVRCTIFMRGRQVQGCTFRFEALWILIKSIRRFTEHAVNGNLRNGV